MRKSIQQYDAFFGKEALKLGIETSGLGIRTAEHNIKANLDMGSGLKPVLTSSTVKATGKSTIKGNTLEKGQHFACDMIRIGYSNDAAANKETDLMYATALPPALRNATLKISQNGKVIFSQSVSSLSNPNAGNSRLDDYTEVSLFLWKADEEISIEYDFPTGASVVANNPYVETSFLGATTFIK